MGPIIYLSTFQEESIEISLISILVRPETASTENLKGKAIPGFFIENSRLMG